MLKDVLICRLGRGRHLDKDIVHWSYTLLVLYMVLKGNTTQTGPKELLTISHGRPERLRWPLA